MRVALLGRYPLGGEKIHGGVQAAGASLLNGLARISGLEIHIITFHQYDAATSQLADRTGIHLHPVPGYARFERLRDYRMYQRSVEALLAEIQPDLIHAQEAAADAYIALRTGLPTVVTAHGIRAEDAKHAQDFRQKLRLFFDSLHTERAVMRRAKYLVAISRYVVDYFAPLLRPDIQIRHISNAIGNEFFELGAEIDQPNILYAGRVTQLKRVTDLVQAFAQIAERFPHANLRIAGECTSEPNTVRGVRRQILEAGLGERVHLLGSLPQTELMKEYQACRFVVLPSAQENAPMSLAQAMAAGKPVVATQVGGVPEMVGTNNERGRLVRAGDIEGLAAAMAHYLGEPTAASCAGKAARAFACQHFHSDCVANQTFQFYQEVIAAERKQHG